MRWPENWRAAGGAWCFCLGGARFVFLLLLLATAFEFPNSQKKWNVFSPSSLISACAPLYFFSCWKLRAAAAMTERGRTTAARRRRAAGTEPAESESKEQTNVEKTATNDPEYTWSQTADEVMFKMPVRLQTERLVFVCVSCLVRKVDGQKGSDDIKMVTFIPRYTSLTFVPRGATTT